MIRNTRLPKMIDELSVIFNSMGVGISNTISMSNTIKMIANRKNRRENGIRALWFGSNPHSNGEDFSRSFVDREAKAHAKKNTTIGIRIAALDEIIIMIIN